MYKHGIKINENPTETVKPKEGTSGIAVVIGTSPINLLDDPEKAVNRPIAVRSYEEAVKKMGYSEDYEKYTISQSIYASFKQFSVAPIVLINVLDTARHKEAVTEQEVKVENRQATLKKSGMLMKALVVKREDAELKSGTDYIATFDEDGFVVISLLESGSAGAATTLKVSGDRIAPEKVTAQDIIGGYDAVTGKETGMACIRQVFPSTGLVPGLLIAPGWSKDANVGAALISKCKEINGLFRAFAVIDISTAKSTKYEDVAKEKETCGFDSEDAAVLWPMIAVGERKFAYSALYAAKLAANDMANDDVVAISASNQDIGATAAVLEDGTEVTLDEMQANELNAIGVVTVNNFAGKIYTWGNNTSAYPRVTDVKDRRIGCRRFFSWWGNRFILDYHEHIDSPATVKKIEALVDMENIKGNSLAAQGKCAGASISFDASQTETQDLIEGNIEFTQKLAPYTPMEYISNTLEFDTSMLEAEFKGGN